MFVQIDSRTLSLKMVEREFFLMKPKHQYHLPNKEEMFMVPNHKKKGDNYLNPCLSQLRDELQF